MTALSLRITGTNESDRIPRLAGNVRIGIQRGKEAIDCVAADAAQVIFTCTIEVQRDDPETVDFRGPFVHGKRGARFLYLVWQHQDTDGAWEMCGRLKLNLAPVPISLIDRAIADGATLAATMSLTDERGRPRTASVPADVVTWTVDQPGSA